MAPAIREPVIALWDYVVHTSDRDCDGQHHVRERFVSVRSPTEETFGRASLLSEDGPSQVSVLDDATDICGTSYVYTPGDEGGETLHEIHWSRVTDRTSIDAFLRAYEEQGPDHSIAHRYTDLYRLRLRDLVQGVFPEARSLRVRPAQVDDGWVITEIRGWEEEQAHIIWSGAILPLSFDVADRVLTLLGKLYSTSRAEPEGRIVRL